MIKYTIMEWKWTKGESYQRSRRHYNENNTNNTNNTNTNTNIPEHERQLNEFIQNEKHIKEIETSAYSSSLNYDENTWDILNQEIALNGFKNSNKREDLDFKIADRELVQQIGGNPFLNEQNYADDISIRDKFLKPINTTEGRVKPNDTNA